MRRWLFVMLILITASVIQVVAIRNMLAVYHFKSEWYWWLLVVAEVLAAAAMFVYAFELIARTPVDKSKPLDLTTELQAQLAAEMIRQHSLKRIDISQDGGVTINGTRVEGV